MFPPHEMFAWPPAPMVGVNDQTPFGTGHKSSWCMPALASTIAYNGCGGASGGERQGRNPQGDSRAKRCNAAHAKISILNRRDAGQTGGVAQGFPAHPAATLTKRKLD